MRKLRRNVKKQGYRALTAVMIASSLLGMTAPAFANDDVQPTPIVDVQPDSNSEGNGTGSSTTDKTVPEDTSNQNEKDTPDENEPENVTDPEQPDSIIENEVPDTVTDPPESEDITKKEDSDEMDSTDSSVPPESQCEDDSVNAEAKQDETNKEQEDKAAKEKAEKARQEKINAASEEAAKAILDLAKGKYKNVDEALEGLSNSALQIINKTFIKELPGIGPFLASLIDGATSGGENATNKRLDDINNQLTVINQTIKDCTQKILGQQNAIQQSGKIGKINTAFQTLMDSYKNTYLDLSNALTTSQNSEDLKELKKAGEALNKVYSSENRDAFKNYVSYIQTITNCDNQIPNFGEFDPDVFAAFKDVVTYGKNGKHAYQEFVESRKDVVNNVESTCKYGYEMFSLTFEIAIAKQETMMNAYQKAMDSLKKEMANADAEKVESLQASYDKIKNLFDTCQRSVQDMKADQKKLEGLKTTYEDFVKKERDQIVVDTANFEADSKTRKDTVTVNSNDFGTEEIDGRVTYPTVNKKDHTIEYRDQYGNLLGKRTIATNLTDVDEYKVQVGKVYFVDQSCATGKLINQSSWYVKSKIKITKVYQRPIMTIDFLFTKVDVGSETAVKAISLETGKESEYIIGGAGTYRLYEYVIGDLEKC